MIEAVAENGLISVKFLKDLYLTPCSIILYKTNYSSNVNMDLFQAQARRRWGPGGFSPLHFFAEQQNIFSKRFQLVTTKFFVFFRTSKKKESE